MNAHTKGPWVWVRADLAFRSEADEELVLALGCDGMATDVRNGMITWEEFAPSEADARLIAAAPDLLNALKVLADVAERKGIPCDAARAAIAKATGETK
jgi:hypothetical protein